MLSHSAHPLARAIADRHYNRQKPESIRFVPPGRCVVFTTPNGDAVWATSWPYAEYVRHAWAGAWVNSLFRNESDHLSSELIREAIAATLWKWPEPPTLGIVTFVDASKVRHKRDPGRCYTKAGFTRLKETTKGGLVVLQMLPEDMPEPSAPLGSKVPLFVV
jgi:hypothetical protein